MRYRDMRRWMRVEGIPRLKAVFKRAFAEDDFYQLLNHVQEAHTCIEAADRPEGVLVEDWAPNEYRQHAKDELQQAEAILKRIGGY